MTQIYNIDQYQRHVLGMCLYTAMTAVVIMVQLILR